MTYPGNGIGRRLSKEINDRYYFINGAAFENNNMMRGFDCTTFPMALLAIPNLPSPGYGKQLCDAAGAARCGIEQIKSSDLQRRFKDDDIPEGICILFSEGHVMLYNSDINMLYEFNEKDGSHDARFRVTPAGDRALPAKHGLWWMRKLDESYRPSFL